MIHLNKQVTTPIIPTVVEYYSVPGEAALDFKAICCFMATGFFLEAETFCTNKKAFLPAASYSFNQDGNVEKKEFYFKWHHAPRDIKFSQVIDDYAALLERTVKQGTENRQVILPLSGGLDSRTLAAALGTRKNVFAYSYEFKNGIQENKYGRLIAQSSGYPFDGHTIQHGYLWESIEKTARLNGCYADFTNPRQVAAMDSLKNKGDIFLLGHWGDVLFDDMGVAPSADFETQLAVIKGKILKRKGVELAEKLWQAWGLADTFGNYLDEKLRKLLDAIDIRDANARIRAFKSTYWATRWTSSNLTLFNASHDSFVPYFHDEMCRFICTVPERYLAGRQIQIAYLKKKAPQLAAIPWQKYDPCNLFTYKEYTSLRYLPYRVMRKIKNEAMNLIGKKKILSNWELQFLGSENDRNLRKWLFENSSFSGLVPQSLTKSFYDKFRAESGEYHHTINMLLTLSLFSKLRNDATPVS